MGSPSRERTPNLFAQLNTPKYLRGHAAKAQRDIEKLFRLYAGKEVHVFQVDHSGGACPVCIDAFTGARMYTGCETCSGTGKVNGWTRSGPHWALLDIGAKAVSATELGTTEIPAAGRDQVMLVGAPQLRDGDLIGLVDTRELYKVDTMEPQISAIGGTIILQNLPVAYLALGSTEHASVPWL